MTDVKVGIIALLAAFALVGAMSLSGTRFRAASDVPLGPIRLGPPDIEVVAPATPATPPDLGDGTEVHVDRLITYGTTPEYLPEDDAQSPARSPGR